MGDDDLRGRFRRDFTHEPIKSGRPETYKPQAPTNLSPSQQPTHKSEPAIQIPKFETNTTRSETKKHKKKRGKKKFLIFIIIVLILAGAGAAAYKYYYLAPAVPAKIQSQSDIAILYPTKLPSGFTINKSSYSVTDGNIVTYYASDSQGNRIVFTVQQKPSNFDFDKFYAQSLTNSNKFTTPLGAGIVGNASGRLLGSLTTDKTWILVSSNSKVVDASKIQYALQNLKQTN